MMPCFHHAAILLLLSLSWLRSDMSSAQNTMAECGPNLLPLAPCAPFVQGAAAMPLQTCCESLAQVYSQKPECVCLLLNDTSLSSTFPINTTLALQLPALCGLRISPSSCPGISITPPTDVSFGAKPNSSVAASSPIVTVAPRPSSMVFGIHHSAQMRLKPEGQLLMVMLQLYAIIAVLTKLRQP